MGSRPTRRKLLATVAVLAALALGAATLQAAVGWQPASAAPQVEASAGGFGGKLSDRLLLRLEDVSSGLPEQVYSGGLAAMPELQLGTLAPGEARTYRRPLAWLNAAK